MATPIPHNEANRKQIWAKYLTALMSEQGLSNGDLVRRLDRPSYTSSIVSAWTSGRSGAAPDACIRIAEVTARPVPEVLRAAGHDEIADWIDLHQPGRVDQDPVTARIREIARELPPADRRELEDRILQQIGALEDYARLKTAELLRQQQQGHDGEDQSNAL